MPEVKGPWGETFTVEETPAATTPEQPTTPTDVLQDTPAATPTDTPAAPADAEPQIKEVIKEIIKEVPVVPQFASEAAKTLYEKLVAGDEDELATYLEEKRRNYDTMSDIDVVKWQLRKQNPEWTDKDINSEIKFKYGKSLEKVDLTQIDRDENPEEYAQAEKHNDAIDDKLLMLERDSRDARIYLNKNKQTIELPKLTGQEQPKPQDAPTPEQLAETKRQWDGYVDAEMGSISDFRIDVDGEEVAYVFTKEEKDALKAEMKDYDPAKTFIELGWRDAEGNLKPAKMAKDMHILRNLEKFIRSAHKQGKDAGKEKTITEEIKNINLKPQSLATSAPQVDVWQRSSGRYKSN